VAHEVDGSWRSVHLVGFSIFAEIFLDAGSFQEDQKLSGRSNDENAFDSPERLTQSVAVVQ